MKFKVGDKVRIIVTPQMYKLFGKIIKISAPYGVIFYEIISNDTYHVCREYELELHYDIHDILEEIIS